MKVRVLGCSGGMSKGHASTCLQLGGSVLLDAGTGAGELTSEEMLGIKDIIISHSHLDHIASICFITDQDIEHPKEATRVHALPATVSSFKRFVVNEVIWPEIQKVRINGVPMISFHELVPFQKVTIQGVCVTPFPVTHAVPTLGFCIHGEEHDMVFISDMIDAEQEVWDFINDLPRLRYFITEAAFPDKLEEIARISKHLTPSMLADICRRLKKDGLEFYATHLKPLYHEQVCAELAQIDNPAIKVLEAGMEFEL